jgi:predicted transcriptional regulator
MKLEDTMDKIMSTRMDEAVIQRIGMLAKKLRTSKKAVLENAIRHYAEKMEAEFDMDILENTCGSWCRDESAADMVHSIKEAMRKSQERHKR